MGFFNRFSNKLILVYLIATLIPLGTLSIYGIKVTENVILDSTINDFMEDMTYLSSRVEHSLTVDKGTLIHISHLVPSMAPLKIEDLNESFDQARIDFLEFAATHPLFHRVGYIDENGSEIITVVRDHNRLHIEKGDEILEITDEEFFEETQKLQKGELYISGLECDYPPENDSKMGLLGLDYGYALFDSKGDKGIVFATFDAGQVIDSIISEALSEQRKMTRPIHFPESFILVDDKGRYVYRSKDLRADSGSYCTDNGAYLREEFPLDYQQILSGESGGLITKDYLIGFSKLYLDGKGNYTFIGIVDYETAIAPMIYMRNVIYSVLIIIFFLSILISIILARRFTEPINVLVKCAKKVSSGNLNTKADVRTNDELQEFAKVFNEMINNIKQREKDIEEKTRELRTSANALKSSKTKLEKNVSELKTSRTAMLNIMEDINRANEELKSLDKAKDEFLSIVSHELKTPITPIKTYVDMLIDGDLGKVTNKQKESLRVITRNVARLKLLIDDLLDITRLETGKMKLNFKDTIIGEIFKSIIKERKFTVKRKGIKLSYVIDKPLHSVLDFNRISQVLANLVDNSIKFTPSGGSITINAKKRKGYVIVSVKDTGIGINEENLPHIFEKFYQVDSSLSRKYGGTGLGLSICKGIIEQHKGEIWVESEVDKETIVYFSLPIKHKK